MKFVPTPFAESFIVELQPIADDRGFFSRGWCQREFEEHGLDGDVAQVNISYNRFKGTLRGLHQQIAPDEETKVVRCVRGSLYDVIVDVRTDSPTYGKWFGAELSAENRHMLITPKGFLHGFQTLEDDTEAMYHVSAFYAPGAERGARYDDPAFAIDWPLPVSNISDKDAAWP